MTNVRWSIAAMLIAFTLLTGLKVATAQVTLKAEDLMGTWEMVSTKDLQTGDAVLGLNYASTGIQWMQFTRSHYMVVAMVHGRKVTMPEDLAKLSPEEKVKTNCALIWNEKSEQIFAARRNLHGEGRQNIPETDDCAPGRRHRYPPRTEGHPS
jgi:hypothetical protein